MNIKPIPYASLLLEAQRADEDTEEFLIRELMRVWLNRYIMMYDRPTDVFEYKMGSFRYLFDFHQFDNIRTKPEDQIDARLIAAIGKSSAPREIRRRHDSRMKGLGFNLIKDKPGPWDKGHYIGHSIGGIVDGNEANVFPQLRRSNRGIYRSLEKYCAAHFGVLCFSRPFYRDGTLLPYEVEFGILKDGVDWHIENVTNSLPPQVI